MDRARISTHLSIFRVSVVFRSERIEEAVEGGVTRKTAKTEFIYTQRKS